MKLLTRGEAAVMLGVSPRTIARWEKDGRLRSYGIGRRRYYSVDEIRLALVERGRGAA